MRIENHTYFFAIALIFVLLSSMFYSCRKDDFTTDSGAKLSFSTDTLLFDTVFTTMSSTTKRIKVYNKNSDNLIISDIRLQNGANSQFRINVDGLSGNQHSNVEIRAGDSIYIFLEVTIDPNSVLSPFVVEEQLLFSTNGNNQKVHLMAWGQNAHYFTPKKYVNGLPPYSCLDGDCSGSLPPVTANWINDKPYVIVGYLVIDSLDKLVIDAGVKVHLHNNSGLWVYKDGNLVVNGTPSDPVTFQGTRLEYTYQDISGQWDRIWINEGSADNVINHAIIKNAFIGIQAEPLPFNPTAPTSTNKLRLNGCEITNSAAVNLLATNYQITDTNSLITQAGQSSIFLRGGGNYKFYHTTIANFWDQGTRDASAVFLQNYYQDVNGNVQVRDIDSAVFVNTIIEGNNEIEFDTDVLAPGVINFKIDYSIVRSTKSLTGPNYVGIIQNPSIAVFNNYLLNDYRLWVSSPAVNAGKNAGVTIDILGNSRTLPYDLGAYEN